jgi:hypothetical protein
MAGSLHLWYRATTMFVRFRQTGDRLQVSLVEPRRVGGKVRHEHIAGLGSVAVPPTVEGRLTFWRKVEARLAKLGNRVNGEDAGRIRGQLYARIPMPSIEEQRAVQLSVAMADAQTLTTVRDMHAEGVALHERLAATVSAKIAAGRDVLAGAAAARDAACERVAAIERGEDVPGGLSRPLDPIAILKSAGMTDADIRYIRDEAEVYRLLAGDDEARADILTRKLTDAQVDTVERFERRFIRRLLRNLRAEREQGADHPAEEGQ